MERARADLRAGRLWKARDRAAGLHHTRPTDPDVLELCAVVAHRMGDLPRAGAFWYLTECRGPEVDEAIAALHERYRPPLHLAAALPVRGPIDAYPEAVQERLDRLSRTIEAETGRRWPSEFGGPQGSASVDGVWVNSSGGRRPAGLAGCALQVGCLVVTLLLVLSTVVGLVTLVGWACR
jgi:hypothetical protein